MKYLYLINKSTYLNDRCHDIDEIYTDMGKVSSLDPNDPEIKDMKLRDFYIKCGFQSSFSNETIILNLYIPVTV